MPDLREALKVFQDGAAWHSEAAAIAGFSAGWNAREAEVTDLKHQLTLFARSQGMRAEWPVDA